MAESKHTPGPWRLNGDEYGAGNARIRNVRAADGTTTVARVETTEADAALIAASPDLAHDLGTLLDAIAAFDGSDFEVHGESIERFAHLMDRYHAAAETLARAEGREVDADEESRSHIPAAI
jgi:hypothetical protein